MGAHDFDFWIGDWDVLGPSGKVAGRNTITAMFDGQSGGMVHEHWHGNGGGRVDRQRITWTRHGEGAEVRQVWETSTDDGKAWTIAFDGRYHRRT